MQSIRKKSTKILLSFGKLAIAGGLIWIMVESGRLDFDEHLTILRQPGVFFFNLMLWITGPLLISSTRWMILLRGMKLDVRWRRCAHMTLVGHFFNAAMPGAVGGDVIKAVYVVKEHEHDKKTAALLSILIDRAIGLFALFTIATLAIAFNFSTVWSEPLLRPVASFVFIAFFGTLTLASLMLLPNEATNGRWGRILSFHFPGKNLFKKLYAAMRSYRKHPETLLYAWGMSIVMQSIFVLFYWYITQMISPIGVSLAQLLVVIPVGIVALAIPLAPGGLGVGHVAFDRLFSLVGLDVGANVFNIVFIGQMSLNLLCVVPYLMFRSKKPEKHDTR